MGDVIAIKKPDEWFNANLTKRSISWMKARNTDGKFTKAIEGEELLLRSFFTGLKDRCAA